MERAEAQALLRDAERLRRRARGDRHASSVPLLSFGGLTVLSAPLLLPRLFPWGDLFWLLAGPAGFLATGWWYRRQQARSGVGEGRGSWTVAAVSMLLALALLLAAGLVALRRERAGR